jgi:hypothetical protein
MFGETLLTEKTAGDNDRAVLGWGDGPQVKTMPRRRKLFFASLLLLSVMDLLAGAGEVLAQRAGRLSGRVSVTGHYPLTKTLPVFKNRDYCGARIANETLLLGRDRGLKNAVIILQSMDKPIGAEPKRILLDNQRCAFVPHVQVAPLGSDLLLKNSDAILHTVHARLGFETLFNVGLPRWRTVTKRLDRAGVIKIDCDVLHTWMTAVIVIADTPYYAQSDDSGVFSVDGVPPGHYEMSVFHEKFGYRIQRLMLHESELVNLDIVFSAANVR